MSLEFQSRSGDTYYLQQGKTKAGKPRYYLSRKMTGQSMQQIPEGFEVHLTPERGQPVLRKLLKTAIAANERLLVENGVRSLAKLPHFLVDVEKDSLVVYLPTQSDADVDRILEVMTGMPVNAGILSLRSAAVRELVINSTYQKMMRFQLADRKNDLFTVER